jgi:hypothetical protein
MHPTFTGQIAAQRIAELHQAAERWRLCQRQTGPEAVHARRRGRPRLSFGRSRPVVTRIGMTAPDSANVGR